MPKIPVVDIAPLFGRDQAAIDTTDHQIAEAAFDIGFMVVRGYPSDIKAGAAERHKLLKLFDLPHDVQRPYWKRNFAPETAHVYRGWFPLSSSPTGGREGYEIGPDIVRDLPVNQADDLLCEPTPLPDPELLPKGWRETAAGAHVDSGLLTLLATCGVGGLQARHSQGDWIDVPVIDDGFAINFGGLLERWTSGRIKATLHRVLGQGEHRYSIPFFFEPRPSTEIAPLPIEGIKPFAPFLYGDHLWATTTKFPENLGLGHLRPARAPYTDPMAG